MGNAQNYCYDMKSRFQKKKNNSKNSNVINVNNDTMNHTITNHKINIHIKKTRNQSLLNKKIFYQK